MIDYTEYLIDLIKKSEPGSVHLDHAYYFLRKHVRKLPNKKDYLVSCLVSIVKFDDNKINISYLDLPKGYNGKTIDLLNNEEYPWKYETLQLSEFRKIDFYSNHK